MIRYEKVSEGKSRTNRILNFFAHLSLLVFLLMSSSLVPGLALPDVDISKFGDDRGDTALQESGFPKFKEVGLQKGLNYSSQRRESRIQGVLEIIGREGVYVSDYNRDGWPDILVIGGKQPGLYRNNHGNFQRVNSFPEFDNEVYSAHFYDQNNNGYDDLLVLPKNSTPVFLRNDKGEFNREKIGFETVKLGSTPRGAASADFDGDGCLEVAIIDDVISPGRGKPDHFFQGNCESVKLVEQPVKEGDFGDSKGSTLAISFTDFTGDGIPDIHKGKDFDKDDFYTGSDGYFSRRDMGSKSDHSTMSSEIGDINNDGDPDIFVTFIFEDRLYINQGESFTGGNNSFGAEWGWASVLTDLDNDMDLDIFHSSSDRNSAAYPGIWENRDDMKFSEIDSSSLGFEKLNARGMAELDFDRDGDMDILIATRPNAESSAQKSRFRLYENLENDSNYLQVRVGSIGHKTSIGSKVTVEVDDKKMYRFLNSKSDFNSQDTRILHFGLANHSRVDRITVEWPSGIKMTYRDIRANQRIKILPTGIDLARKK